ncbi:MAG: YwiC-like family protein [Chloroflexota bacterium]
MQTKPNLFKQVFQKQIAFPSDHGSWVFLLSPLLIGIFTSRTWSSDILYLVLGLLAAFFLRQPAAVAVKAFAKRRSKQVLPSALFWMAGYSAIGLIAIVQLILRGYHTLLWLLIPGGAVFIWHLWLVSKRSERHRMGVDIIASGTLALAAPAAYWVSLGESSPLGWLMWILAWLQSAASIVYAFLRLSQRKLSESPIKSELLIIGRRALMYSGFNLFFSIALSFYTQLPDLIWLPYLLQFAETYRGVTVPAIGQKPTSIGFRQLVVSTIFTVLFILVWYL